MNGQKERKGSYKKNRKNAMTDIKRQKELREAKKEGESEDMYRQRAERERERERGQ